MPGGTYFLYVRAPKGCNELAFANAEEASQFLITRAIGLLRAVGQRRGVPALLGDLPGQG